MKISEIIQHEGLADRLKGLMGKKSTAKLVDPGQYPPYTKDIQQVANWVKQKVEYAKQNKQNLSALFDPNDFTCVWNTIHAGINSDVARDVKQYLAKDPEVAPFIQKAPEFQQGQGSLAHGYSSDYSTGKSSDFDSVTTSPMSSLNPMSSLYELHDADLENKSVIRKKYSLSPNQKFVVEGRRVIMEGGNVFELPDDTAITQRIKRQDIEPTIKWLEKITGLSLMDNALGSVGKKESSGDLDLAVDETKLSKDDLLNKLVAWCKSQNIPDDQILNRAKKGGQPAYKAGWVAKSGISVHFRTPIRGNPKNGFVQTDFMFTSDPQWMKFGMYSPGDASKYSGADRNLLMSSIAKAQGMKYSWQKGLVRREDEAPISKDADVIAKKLFGPGATRAVFDSVETMQAAINKNTKLKQLIKTLYGTLEQDPRGQEEAQRLQRLLGNVVA